jgi:hypothetical protein
MSNIKISENKTNNGWEFNITIEGQSSETNHIVTMSEGFYNSLNTQISPTEVVEKSFNFLLQREPKEQILSEFNITLISKYFPEYNEFIRNS